MPTSKFNLRLPSDLQQQAAELAAAQGISLNAFIALAVGNWVDYQGRKRATPSPTRRTANRSAIAAPAERSPRSAAPDAPPSRPVPRVGANQPCPCGSGQKYKRCHGRDG